MGFIYKATNTVNGKVYIGQTIRTIEERWKEHLCDTYNPNRSTYSCSLHSAIRKYSEDAFQVESLEECDNAQLNNREAYWIGVFLSNDRRYGYNLTTGGDSNYIKSPESEATRHKKSCVQLGQNNSFFGKHHSITHRAKIATPVVSFTDDGRVYKYYMSQIAAKVDGFAQNHITSCVSGKVLHHGKTPSGDRLRWRLATSDEQDTILRACIDNNMESLTTEQFNSLKEAKDNAIWNTQV